MKNLTTLLAVTLALSGTMAAAQPFHDGSLEDNILIPASTAESMTQAQWKAYGERITEALGGDHEGLRHGALRGVIQYGKHFDLPRAAILDMARLYRDHKNVRTRRMAVVAIGQTRSNWAIDYLERSLAFERDPAVRHTVASVLIEVGAIGVGPSRIGG